jgi:hypothetical protein
LPNNETYETLGIDVVNSLGDPVYEPEATGLSSLLHLGATASTPS